MKIKRDNFIFSLTRILGNKEAQFMLTESVSSGALLAPSLGQQ